MAKHTFDLDRIIEIVEAFEREKHNDTLDGKVMFGLSKLISKLRPTYRHFLQAREPKRLHAMKLVELAKTHEEKLIAESEYQLGVDELKTQLRDQAKEVEHFDFKECQFIAQEDLIRKRFVGEGATLRMEEVKISKGTNLVSGEFLAAMGDLIQ